MNILLQQDTTLAPPAGLTVHDFSGHSTTFELQKNQAIRTMAKTKVK